MSHSLSEAGGARKTDCIQDTLEGDEKGGNQEGRRDGGGLTDRPWVLWSGEGSGRKQAAVESEAMVMSGATAGVTGVTVAVVTGHA